MKKIALGAVIGVGILFGLDYSKMSNEELIKQSGKFPTKEVLEYYAELDKRSQKMTKEQARDFFLQIQEEGIKNEEQMLVKDLKQRKREIHAILAKAKDRPYTHKYMKKIHSVSHGGCGMNKGRDMKHKEHWGKHGEKQDVSKHENHH